MNMTPETWDTLIGYAIAFALGVALTILILGE
jgi:ABC-type nitrate/sulfonate/bicarbonate transport system permease component